MAILEDTVAETVGVDEATPLTWDLGLTQGFGVTYRLIDVFGHPVTASDTIGVAEALVASYGQVILERLRIALTQVPNHAFQLSLSDDTSIDEGLFPGVPVALSETIGVTLTQLAQQATSVIEALGLQDALTPAFTYNRSVSEALQLADALTRFFGAEAVETIGITDALSGIASKPGTIAETIGVAAEASPQMVLRVVAADELQIEPVEALQMLFSPVVSDSIELSAAYLSPGGGILTWAMNTRTGAVTEYQNYAFNSFAKLGNKYIGASSSGLYELLGDDDAGTDIIATIRSGMAQWAGTHLGSFKAAYLAVRGEGSFVLRVLTGDGKTYNYTVTAESMTTTKVNMGKGLRARYFAFELVSTGQDFDLDTLEFIPLIADRRI